MKERVRNLAHNYSVQILRAGPITPLLCQSGLRIELQAETF